MQNNFIQILFLTAINRNSIPVVAVYLLIFVAIIFILVKLNNDNYLRQLFDLISLDKNKSEQQPSVFRLSKSSFFLQITLIILFSLGLSILSHEYFGNFNLAHNFLGVVLFYIIQWTGFILFSSIAGNTKSSFISHRLSYNEITNIILFPVIFIALYSPYNLSMIVLLVIVFILFLMIVRASAYLTEYISLFHIILYLCTLEIIPVLFLLKFIFN